MESNLMNSFCEMTEEEMMNVEGGAWGIVAGILVGWVVDAVLEETTGKSGAEYVGDGLRWLWDNVFFPTIDCY